MAHPVKKRNFQTDLWEEKKRHFCCDLDNFWPNPGFEAISLLSLKLFKTKTSQHRDPISVPKWPQMNCPSGETVKTAPKLVFLALLTNYWEYCGFEIHGWGWVLGPRSKITQPTNQNKIKKT